MDILAYNREMWNAQVAKGNRWTCPVDAETIAAAKRNEWQVVLTPTKPVPREWFPDLAGLDVLCLASGGGQQAPILAAAGARVTLLDNSPSQLAQDRLVAEREGLPLDTVQGDMADLSAFPDQSFGLIFHPCSNCFAPSIRPVWREAFRVLRPGGVLLAGFTNPVYYIFDDFAAEKGELIVRHSIPYSDLMSITDAERKRYADNQEPFCFGHSLEDQIGGQLDAGFMLTSMFEDSDPKHVLSKFLPVYIATRALRHS
jgi:SAM-dependent methyltransferase